MATIEEIEERRDARKKELAKKAADQYATDLEAIDALEVEHGDGALAIVKVPKFKEGIPTRAVVRTPSGPQYKRYVDQVQKASSAKNSTAQRQAVITLAESCWVYPGTPDARAAMLAEFPGITTTLAIAAAALAEGKAEEEGKG